MASAVTTMPNQTCGSSCPEPQRGSADIKRRRKKEEEEEESQTLANKYGSRYTGLYNTVLSHDF